MTRNQKVFCICIQHECTHNVFFGTNIDHHTHRFTKATCRWQIIRCQSEHFTWCTKYVDFIGGHRVKRRQQFIAFLELYIQIIQVQMSLGRTYPTHCRQDNGKRFFFNKLFRVHNNFFGLRRPSCAAATQCGLFIITLFNIAEPCL